jgi:DNA-binding MarR family transcriptional regulator
MKMAQKPLLKAPRQKRNLTSLGQTASANWTFLTNHTHVLLSVYRQPDSRLRDIAVAVGVTERMTQRIIPELVAAGYLKITKDGRRNYYTVIASLRLRHPLEAQHTIGELLEILQ